MTEYPGIPSDLLEPMCNAVDNAYRVVSGNNFYPLRAVPIKDTDYEVPEMAIVITEYLLFGTPTNGVKVYFERPGSVDGNEQRVMRHLITGIELALDEELSELPEVVARIKELKALLAGGRP